MSLKTVHLIFIIASFLLAAYLAVWCWQRYAIDADGGSMAAALASMVAALGLIWYGVRFIQKFKGIKYF